MTTPNLAHALVIPDSLLAKEATDILRKYSTDLLFNHSIRVYLFAAEQGRQRQLRFDPELLYVAAAFHDLGLTKKFSSQNERFEVDSANAARQFLNAHNIAEDQVQTVWEAIALHTTPGIPEFMEPEVALVTAGVEYDVLGIGYHDISDTDRAEITALHPRPNFKRRILQAFADGIAPKPETTFGNVKADVLERFVPGYQRANFVDIIENSDWPE